MDIAVWLRSLSLEQYEAAFRENAIDADVLHDLTDQDLEKLGVFLGHRRRLLRAIAALDGAVAASSALAPLQVKPSPAAEAAGDRRHVTVMFCDLGFRPVLPRSSTRRNGATCLAPTSTLLRRR